MACSHTVDVRNDPTLRYILWIVLIANGLMFVFEIGAGLVAESVALQADAMDFLADTLNYAISLFVLQKAMRWRSVAALVKGICMGGFGVWIAGSTLYKALYHTTPDAETMGVVAVIALCVNVFSLALLYKFRKGDSNLRSVWLCSRNDVIGNLMVMVAASGVFYTGNGWPDWVVAAAMSTLAMTASFQIIKHARVELKQHAVAA